MDFSKFKLAVAKQFALMSQHELFKTNIPGDRLWAMYLSAFPEGSNPIYRERTEHDCSCCRSFIKAVGGVVAIIDGERVSIWDIEDYDVDPEYKVVAAHMSAIIGAYDIENVFRSEERSAGVDKTYEEITGQVKTWNHFHVVFRASVVLRKNTVGHKLSEYRASFDVFKRSLKEITLDAIDTVLDLVAQNSIYRGTEHKATLTKFREMKLKFDAIEPFVARKIDNFVWASLATVGSPVLRIRNTSIGTLLVDLSEGVDIEAAVKKFEAMVAPANYKRPVALVSSSMIEKAKEKIEELGLTSSLERRYATINDITINNVLYADRTLTNLRNDNVFDQMVKETKQKSLNKVEDVTIDQFIANILPNAKSLEVLVENRHVNNFVSLITAANPTAPSMFQWPNPFSWSYNGNFTDSIKERVKAAGGNVTGELCCRLAWDYQDDLDFHMHEPIGGNHIYYGNRRVLSNFGGMLDVDANGADGLKDYPVENIFYGKMSKMKDGEYKLRVNNFRRRSSGKNFEVEIDVLGEITHLVYEGILRNGASINVATITVKDKRVVSVQPHLPSTQSSKKIWGISTHTFVPVQAIMNSPNYWDDHHVGNKHIFFMLQGCKNDDVARGFYNEFLNSELNAHRKVLEIVGAKMKTDMSDQQLSGVGFSLTQRNNLAVRVTGNFNRVVNVTF